MQMTKKTKYILAAVALLAAVGPNGLYLYAVFTQPELSGLALKNPVALAFMIEAMMLLSLFLWYVYKQTHSWGKVVIYSVLSFMGSLAFSFPLFLYLNGKDPQDD